MGPKRSFAVLISLAAAGAAPVHAQVQNHVIPFFNQNLGPTENCR